MMITIIRITIIKSEVRLNRYKTQKNDIIMIVKYTNNMLMISYMEYSN